MDMWSCGVILYIWYVPCLWCQFIVDAACNAWAHVITVSVGFHHSQKRSNGTTTRSVIRSSKGFTTFPILGGKTFQKTVRSLHFMMTMLDATLTVCASVIRAHPRCSQGLGEEATCGGVIKADNGRRSTGSPLPKCTATTFNPY